MQHTLSLRRVRVSASTSCGRNRLSRTARLAISGALRREHLPTCLGMMEGHSSVASYSREHLPTCLGMMEGHSCCSWPLVVRDHTGEPAAMSAVSDTSPLAHGVWAIMSTVVVYMAGSTHTHSVWGRHEHHGSVHGGVHPHCVLEVMSWLQCAWRDALAMSMCLLHCCTATPCTHSPRTHPAEAGAYHVHTVGLHVSVRLHSASPRRGPFGLAYGTCPQ